MRIEQTVFLDVDARDATAAAELVARAEEGCLVTVSLDLPVATRIEIRPRIPAG